ncbi:MAG: hypothetical protein JJ974_07770 [Phycisphaerales bacterium]|nr:hypothetical protein [Phycisphaerales bacterium]
MGTGYPSGLKGVDIPLSGRIVAAADVLNALCSRRSYKQKISFQESFQMLAERSGTQFDPEVIEACTRCYEQLRSIVESVGHAPTLDDSIKRDVA